MALHPVSTSGIPRDDGAHTNDWVTAPYWFVDRGDKQVRDQRTLVVLLSVTALSGSGSNTWTTTPVVALEEWRHPDNWNVFDPAPCVAAGVAPVIFSEADLPLRRIYRVPMRMRTYALRVTRTGAGDRRILVRTYARGGGLP